MVPTPMVWLRWLPINREANERYHDGSLRSQRTMTNEPSEPLPFHHESGHPSGQR